jgi:hypothetical protein
MKLFAVLANLVLLLHLAWIVWILLGWLATRKRPLLRWLHIGSLLWGICVEAGPWPCPLTILEQWLESHAGSGAYQGSFIVHYLETFIYPDVPQWLLTWFGPAVCTAILAVHARRFWRDQRSRKLRDGSA